jgi:hypothetical protein
MKHLIAIILIVLVPFVIFRSLQNNSIKFRYNPTLSEGHIISQEKNLINKILKQTK